MRVCVCVCVFDCFAYYCHSSGLTFYLSSSFNIIIIIHIFHRLIDALSAHTKHVFNIINLNTIFYSQIENSPANAMYMKYYMKPETYIVGAHTPIPTKKEP